MHALNGDRRGHHGLAVAHAHVDLTLDACPVAQGSHREAAAVEPGLEVFHEAVEDDAIAGQFTDFIRRFAADQVECDTGQPIPRQGPDIAREPARGIDIGRVLITADEKQVLAL